MRPGNWPCTLGRPCSLAGRTDYSTDGRQVTATENGHAMMSRVTGVGCSRESLSAACAAVSPHPCRRPFPQPYSWALPGEMAFEQSPSPGSFAVSLLDSLYALSPEDVVRRARFLSL